MIKTSTCSKISNSLSGYPRKTLAPVLDQSRGVVVVRVEVGTVVVTQLRP